jgi:F0F1-type ATP synthase assembly protein I
MKPEEKSGWRKLGESFRSESIAFAIPMVLVSFPVSGALIGRFLGQWLETPSLTVIGLILGLVMAIREVSRLIRKLNQASR